MGESRGVTRYVFDADMAQVNAKAEFTQKKVKGIGEEFVKGAGGVGQIARNLGRSLGPLAAFSAASAAIQKIWSDIVQKQTDAAGRIQGAAPARARLLSLATSVAERERMSGAVEATRRETGMDETKAAGLQFQLESLGLAGNRAEIARTSKLGLDPEQVAVGVSRLGKVFGDEAKDVTALIDKLFKGAAVSEVDFAEFAETVAKIGSVVQASGTSLDDLIASMAQLGGKDVNELATNLKALSAAAIKQGASADKGGILGFVDKLSSKNLSNQQLAAQLGSVEALEGFLMLRSQRGKIEAGRAGIVGPGATGAVGQALGIVGGDKKIAAAQTAAQVAQMADAGEENRNIDAGFARANLPTAARALNEANGSGWYRSWNREAAAGTIARAGTDAQAIEMYQAMIRELAEINRKTANQSVPRYRPENMAHPEQARPEGSPP